MTLSNARLCFGSYLNDNDNRQSNFMINIVLRMQVIVQIFKKLGSELILSEICAVLQLSLVQLSLSSCGWPRVSGVQTSPQTVQCPGAGVPHVTNQFPTQHSQYTGALTLAIHRLSHSSLRSPRTRPQHVQLGQERRRMSWLHFDGILKLVLTDIEFYCHNY